MDIITYALSKKYTDDTTIGLGALKGAPCTISNISETDTEITLTLSWTGTDGTSETSVLTIPKGQDGEDGVTPFASVARNADDDGAVITITDAIGTTQVTVKDGQSGGGIQKEELPAAAAENVGEIYQYIGATTDTLTSGFFYECVSNEDGTYSWAEKQVSQGAADYNKLDNIPLSLDDEENVVVSEKYSDFFDSLKTVEAILVEDTTTYGDDILKFPIGTYYFNNNTLYKSLTNHIGDYAGILTIESIDKTKDPYIDAYAYRQYEFKNYIGDIYTRALESGDIAGTLVADTDWEQVAHISDIPQEIKVLTDEEYTALIQADTIKEDVLYITINGKNMYYNKEQLNLMHISPFAYRNSVVGAMGTIGSNAIGRDSLALGNAATAAGRDAIAIGTGTETGQDVRFQVVLGSFNVVDNEGRYKFILGNGTHAGSSRRSNLHTIDTSGNAWFEGDVYVGGTSQDDATKVALETDIYTITTVEAHYEKAEAGAEGALEVVADDATAADGQINVSNVIPVLDGEVITAGDYVIWVEAATTKDAKFLVEADLDPYVTEDEFKVMTEEELLEKLGLSEEELQGLAQLISDTEVRIDKTYSSSKIYNELNRILEEGKTYTLAEIAKSSGASYKIASSTAEMTSTKYIYLLANGDTYDMYICEEENSAPVKIGTTSVTLTDYYTKAECDERYVLATAFALLNNSIGNVNNLQTTSKVIVDAINEVVISVDGMSTTVTETKDALGDITALETEAKDNVVNAVNEVKKSIDEFETYVELTQVEYDALADDETGKLNETEYRTTDTGRIYKNGVQYGGQEPEVIEGFAKYKEMKEAGLIDPDTEYIVTSDENEILLNGNDVGYNNAESGIQATTVQGAVDKVAEKVDSKAEIDDTSSSATNTYSSAKINALNANRQVKTFDNSGASTEKWCKICSAITGGIGCNIKLTASRADSTATVQYFSALYRDSRYRYTSSYISRERTVYESELVAEYSAYIIADANNDIWVHIPSYGKAIIEIDTRAIPIDGTAGTPVKDYVYSSFESQTIKDKLDRINIKQFNQPGSNTSFKYVTITSGGNGVGGLELNVPYAGKYMFSTPKSAPVYFGSSTHRGYTLNGWAWSDDGKTLYLRVAGFAPFSISVLGSVPKDTSTNNIVTISDMTSTAPEGVTFVSSPVYSNATTNDIVGTKAQYRGSRSIDISTGGKLTIIYSSEYASQAGCYMLLSNFNTEPLLIELGRTGIGQFSVTATHKSENVDTITVTTAGDEYSWYVLQF